MGRPPHPYGCGRGNTGLWRRQTREPGNRRRRLSRAACGDGVSVLVFSFFFCFFKKSRILEQGTIKDYPAVSSRLHKMHCHGNRARRAGGTRRYSRSGARPASASPPSRSPPRLGDRLEGTQSRRTNEKLLASCFGRRQVHTGKQEKRPEGVARIMFSKFHPAPHLALACYRTRIKGVCRFIFLCDLGSPGFLGPGQNPARPSSFV